MSTSLLRADGRALVFDNTTRITISPSVTVTSHPVESGVDVTDHARVNPLTIRLVGMVTETPFTHQSAVGGEAHVLDAISFLNESAGQPLTLVTQRRGSFTSMVMEQWPHDVTRVRHAVFNISLKQIRVAEATSVVIDVADPVDDSGNTDGLPDEDYSISFPDETESGEQASTVIDTSDPDAVEQDSSVLYDIVNAVGE